MFIQPVSMQCSNEQFERDLKPELLKLGYNIDPGQLGDFLRSPYLITNYCGNHREIANHNSVSTAKANGRYYIENYNPQLFLALAARTDIIKGIEGEYWTYIANTIIHVSCFTYSKCYKAISEVTESGTYFIDNENEKNGYFTNFERFKKSTTEELIKQFTDIAIVNNFPEYWKIKPTSETLSIIGKYYNEKLNTNTYTNVNFLSEYFYSHNKQNISILNSIGSTHHSFCMPCKGGECKEIDLAQFMRIIKHNDPNFLGPDTNKSCNNLNILQKFFLSGFNDNKYISIEQQKFLEEEFNKWIKTQS